MYALGKKQTRARSMVVLGSLARQNVPTPFRDSSIPSRDRFEMASRTEVRDTLNRWQISLSDGIRSPGRIEPSAISALSQSLISVCFLVVTTCLDTLAFCTRSSNLSSFFLETPTGREQLQSEGEWRRRLPAASRSVTVSEGLFGTQNSRHQVTFWVDSSDRHCFINDCLGVPKTLHAECGVAALDI